jgi:hypothetical protein
MADWWNQIKKDSGISALGDLGKTIDNKFITGYQDKANLRSKAGNVADQRKVTMNDAANQTYSQGDEYNTAVKRAQGDYVNKRNSGIDQMNQYDRTSEAQSQNYQNESRNQANNTKSVYASMTNKQDDLMNQAQNDSQNAMSLKDSTDPNNAVATQTRGFYDQRAQQEQTQGMANYGVLSSLGAQANQNYASANPLTLGQQVAMQGQNQRQAGEAYARTQQHMQSLRDQGLEQGFARSDLAYNRGQLAQDRYGNAIKDRASLQDQGDNAGRQGRAEQSTYDDAVRNAGQSRVGRNMSRDAEDFNLSEKELMRKRQLEEKRIADLTGAQLGEYASKDAAINNERQEKAGDRSFYQGIIGTGINAGIGAMTGGASTAAGAAVKAGVPLAAAAMAPAPSSAQYGNGSYYAPPPPQYDTNKFGTFAGMTRNQQPSRNA